MNERILFVDDDPNILDGFKRTLQRVLRVHTALGPHVGLRTIEESGPFAVVVADMNMPLMNGVEFLKKVKEISPNTVRMMLTGNANMNVAIEAVNEGSVFRFLTKPCPSKVMADALVAGISQYRLIMAEQELLQGTLTGIVDLLAEILSWISPELFNRALQIRNTVRLIVKGMQVERPWEIEMAATLSQIGLLALPPETVSAVASGRPLTPEEEKSLATVPQVGYELLTGIPRLEGVAQIVLHQRTSTCESLPPVETPAERKVPLGAHVLTIAIDYHDLRTAGMSREDSCNMIEQRRERYRPDVLAAFLEAESRAADGYDSPNVVALPFHELKTGHVLRSPIYSLDGRRLVGENVSITEALLIRLRGLQRVGGIKEPIQVALT